MPKPTWSATTTGHSQRNSEANPNPRTCSYRRGHAQNQRHGRNPNPTIAATAATANPTHAPAPTPPAHATTDAFATNSQQMPRANPCLRAHARARTLTQTARIVYRNTRGRTSMRTLRSKGNASTRARRNKHNVAPSSQAARAQQYKPNVSEHTRAQSLAHM